MILIIPYLELFMNPYSPLLHFSKLIYCFGDSMAPSSGRTPPGTQNGPPSANDWNTLDMKVSSDKLIDRSFCSLL